MNNDLTKLPYRLGVGLMIINQQKKIFVGKRIDSKNPFSWQMPQGGIDIGETPSKAAIREMTEEIGCDKGDIIAETRSWYCYDLPPKIIPKMWNGQFKGQKQKWFLIKYTGLDSDINLDTPHPEFNKWKWIKPNHLTKVVIPFKKSLYEAVIKEFRNLL
jgi:putative (di)nucleoside polyphosphate hydrolase